QQQGQIKAASLEYQTSVLGDNAEGLLRPSPELVIWFYLVFIAGLLSLAMVGYFLDVQFSGHRGRLLPNQLLIGILVTMVIVEGFVFGIWYMSLRRTAWRITEDALEFYRSGKLRRRIFWRDIAMVRVERFASVL